MDNSEFVSVTAADIRKTVTDFLQQRLINNSHYKSETSKLAKAEESEDNEAILEAKQNLQEIEQKFAFDNWLEDALGRRISQLAVATHLAKGIHSKSKGDNVNYNTQHKALSNEWVSSSIIDDLPFDATGNAAALDIWGLLNQPVTDNITLLQLVIDEHSALPEALSNNPDKSALYLANLKKLLNNNWDNPTSSALNKEFYWLNSDEPYLSQQEDKYRLLIPLHPSSLCHVAYQKIQVRFADENRQAREQKNKKNVEQQPYFFFSDLAIVKLGGSNPQGVSQLMVQQAGRNFLLPSMPPKIAQNRPFRLTKHQDTIFNKSLRYRCWRGFKLLFDVIKAPKSIKPVREQRKEAFQYILAEILGVARHIQSSHQAGWSEEYQLRMSQKYWLDPERAKLEGQEDFSEKYQSEEWVTALAKEFARWINEILKKESKSQSKDFDDTENREWQREFHEAVKASKRKKEGIF